MILVYEEKNISKAIMRVGLPAMPEHLTTLIYNLADTFFVSLTKEPTMIAAVTLCAPILLIMSIASIFGMGGSTIYSGSNHFKLLLETEWCHCSTAYCWNNSNGHLHIYVY